MVCQNWLPVAYVALLQLSPYGEQKEPQILYSLAWIVERRFIDTLLGLLVRAHVLRSKFVFVKGSNRFSILRIDTIVEEMLM